VKEVKVAKKEKGGSGTGKDSATKKGKSRQQGNKKGAYRVVREAMETLSRRLEESVHTLPSGGKRGFKKNNDIEEGETWERV